MHNKKFQSNALTGSAGSKYEHDQLRKKLNEANWKIIGLEGTITTLHNRIQLLQREISQRNKRIEELESLSAIKLYNQNVRINTNHRIPQQQIRGNIIHHLSSSRTALSRKEDATL